MREDRDEQLQTSLPIEPEPLDLNSVVGRPFPVSPTVEKMCRHFKLTCDETLEGLLSQFAQEPRDPPWSAKAEAALRDYVLLNEPGKFSIHTIECRTTLCIVEVESPYGQLRCTQKPAFKLGCWISTTGYKAGPGGGRITVSLKTFQRL